MNYFSPEDIPFIIIVPTLNGKHTLASTLRTCSQQKHERLEIVVSDNASDDNIKESVQAVGDPRLRYIRTPKRLSMTNHWNFALAQTNYERAFVLFLGDDDGLLPNAISNLAMLIYREKVGAIAWQKIEYHWPNHVFSNLSRYMRIPTKQRIERRNTAVELNKVFDFKGGYDRLPGIYSGCVAGNALAKILKESKTCQFFASVAPDVYSAIAVAGFLDYYLYSQFPLSINGASNSSNGTRTANSLPPSLRRDDFRKTSALHPALSWDNFVATTTLDAILRCNENYPERFGGYSISFENYVHKCASEFLRKPTRKAQKEAYDSLQELGRKYGIDVDTIVSQYHSKLRGRPLSKRTIFHKGFTRDHLVLDSGDFGVTNVFDAAQLAAHLLGIKENDFDVYDLCNSAPKGTDNRPLFKKILLQMKRLVANIIPRTWHS